MRSLTDSMGKLSFSLNIIPSQDLTYQTELVRGGFGIVHQGHWRYGGTVAIKQLQGDLGQDAIKEFQEEATVMAQLNSPCIIRLYGICLEKGKYAMVMELMPKGSLFDLLHSDQQIPWDIRYQIAGDVGRGLSLLHEKNIIHRDLKSLNILLDEKLHAKLCDFGLAKLKMQSRSSNYGRKNPNKGGAGTTNWMAPELFKPRGQNTKAADVYSFGMVMWELASRQIPFQNAQDPSLIGTWLAQGETEEIPADCSDLFGKLIQSAWALDPKKRPSIDEVVQKLEMLAGTAMVKPIKLDSGPVYQGTLSAATSDPIYQTTKTPPKLPIVSGPDYSTDSSSTSSSGSSSSSPASTEQDCGVAMIVVNLTKALNVERSSVKLFKDKLKLLLSQHPQIKTITEINIDPEKRKQFVQGMAEKN